MTDARGGDGPAILSEVSRRMDALQNLRLELPRDESSLSTEPPIARALREGLGETIDLLRWCEERYGEEDPSSEPDGLDSLLGIGELISAEVATQEIRDILHLARSELRGALEDLEESVRAGDALRVLSSCDSGLRTVKRCMIAVESTLYEYEGVEPPIRPWADLEISLRTRRLYGELRRQLGSEPRSEEGLGHRLQFVTSQLDSLRELDIYPLLRFDDRVAMREIRDRLKSAVDAGRELAWEDGLHLWQDLVGFVEILRDVNNRQELRQHDRNLVRRTYHRLFGRASGPVGISEEHLSQLRALGGLDDELDQLMQAGSTADLERWREVLERLLHSLTGAPAIPADPWV